MKASKALKDIEDHLPLLSLLCELDDDNRLIVIEKLNAKACRALEKTINLFFSLTKHKQLQKALNKGANVRHIRNILRKSAGATSRKKALLHIGGNPLALILGAVLPILIEEVAKHL